MSNGLQDIEPKARRGTGEDWIRADSGGAGNEKDRNYRNDCHEPSVKVDLRN